MNQLVAAIATAISCTEASHLDNTNGVFDTYSFDQVKFKTRTNCSLDKYPEVSRTTTTFDYREITRMPVLLFQIRSWLDTDAAQFTQTPILVANDGMSRIELFKDGMLIDTVHVYRYKREELNELLVEMGQPRDLTQSWEKINAAQSFDKMLNNWGAYNEIIKDPEDKKAE